MYVLTVRRKPEGIIIQGDDLKSYDGYGDYSNVLKITTRSRITTIPLYKHQPTTHGEVQSIHMDKVVSLSHVLDYDICDKDVELGSKQTASYHFWQQFDSYVNDGATVGTFGYKVKSNAKYHDISGYIFDELRILEESRSVWSRTIIQQLYYRAKLKFDKEHELSPTENRIHINVQSVQVADDVRKRIESADCFEEWVDLCI